MIQIHFVILTQPDSIVFREAIRPCKSVIRISVNGFTAYIREHKLILISNQDIDNREKI